MCAYVLVLKYIYLLAFHTVYFNDISDSSWIADFALDYNFYSPLHIPLI